MRERLDSGVCEYRPRAPRPGRRGRALVYLTGILLALLLLAPGVAAASLKSSITAALQRQGMAGSGTSVAVYDLTQKRYLYSLRLDALRLPASNEKLVTAAAALAGWSSGHRFGTELYLEPAAPDADGRLSGNVYLRGLGDPSLSTTAFQASHLHLTTSNVRDFVTRLDTLGVKRITGRVVADDGYFDGARTVSTWRPSMIAYCGPLSALTLNEGIGSDGRRVTDPSLWTASKLTKLLRAAGIEVPHSAARGVVPATATLVYTERSASLERVLAAMNKPSDNYFAEELLRGLGASFGDSGTTAAGATVAARFLSSIGVRKGFRLRDGSGLSYQNKLSAHTIIKILSAMKKRPDSAVFRRSLAVAGVDGTLKHRMRETRAAGNVCAKTGTLAAASTLSGYVTTTNRHALAFSILMNGSRLSIARAHAAQDSVAVILAGSRP